MVLARTKRYEKAESCTPQRFLYFSRWVPLIRGSTILFVVVLRKNCTGAARKNSGADTRATYDAASCVSTCGLVEYCAVVDIRIHWESIHCFVNTIERIKSFLFYFTNGS